MGKNGVPKTISDLKMYCWSHRLSEYECRVSLGECEKRRRFTCIVKNQNGECLVFKTKAMRKKEFVFSGPEAEACAILYDIILIASEKVKKKEQFWESKPIQYTKKAIACAMAFMLFVNLTWTLIETVESPRHSSIPSGSYTAPEPTKSGYYLYKGKLFFKTCFGWARFSKRDNLWYAADADPKLASNPDPFFVDESDLRLSGNLVPYDWTHRIPTENGDVFGDNMAPSFLDQILNQGNSEFSSN